jgi:hypothetical protein
MLMQAILKAHNSDRRVILADSFRGLPRPDGTYEADLYDIDAKYALWRHRQLAISRQQVEDGFRRLGLWGDNLVFLEGWFKDTLPTAPVEKLAVLRLDGDYYESTMDALKHLYPKLSPGGYCIIDDYSVIPACKQAAHDYRDTNGIDDEIIPIDKWSAYWRRTAGKRVAA